MNTPNYNEQPVDGAEYQRTCRITIDNPRGGIPSAMTVEENVTTLSNGKVISELAGNLYITFDPENADDMFVYNHLNQKVIAARDADRAAKAAAAAQPPA